MDTSAVNIDQVSNMAELIYNFGPVVTVLAVFLVLFLVIVFVVLKGFVDAQKKIQETNENLIQTILKNSESIKQMEVDRRAREPKYDEKNLVDIFIRLNNTFKLDCKKYLEKVEADRIGIYVFHNGTQSSHGLPFFKVSCISEFIHRGCGIGSHIKDCTAVPLVVFDDVIEVLHTYGFTIVRNTYGDDIPKYPRISPQIESSSFYLDKDRARTAIFVGVYDSYESLFAFILAEFLEEIPDEKIDNNLEILREFCARVRPALEFSDYNGSGTKDGDK